MQTIINSREAEQGLQGQHYLAMGENLAMRLWREDLTDAERKPEACREYETVGYVIEGQAELILEGQSILLTPGDSWIVPKNALHSYRILEHFVAIEATCPPARLENE